MNLIIFCAIFCFPTSLAFQVSFHELNLSTYTYEDFPSLNCTPHQFMYQRGDNFTMYVKVLNSTSTVTEARTIIKTCPVISGSNRGDTIKLQTDQIIIEVELLTKDGCLRETILHGTAMSKTAPVKKFTHNDICLKKNKCVAVVNEGRVCRDMKPQPCAVTDNTKPLVSKAAPLDKRQESLNETYKTTTTTTTVLPAMDTSNSLTSQNISRAAENSTGAPTSPSNFPVLTTVLLTAAVALISLLVIAFRHFCRKTYNSPGLPKILPTNENRYYENVVFRDGYQEESAQLEQRASEDPQPSEHHYEEINNY